MARAVANSTLQVMGGLLSIPVALHKISDPKEVKFDRAGSRSGAPIQRAETTEVVDTKSGEVTTVTVAAEDIEYGVYDGDTFKAIPKEALKEIEEATKLTEFEITTFVPLAKVPRNRAQQSYYLMPQSKAGPGGMKPMELLHAALKAEKKAGVVKICLTKRQYLGVVYAEGNGLYITIMAWAEDWTQADRANVLGQTKLDPKMLATARTLVNTLSTDDVQAALDAPVDDLRVLRAKLRDDALAGKAFKPREKKAPVAAPDGLMAALEASLAAVEKKQKVTA